VRNVGSGVAMGWAKSGAPSSRSKFFVVWASCARG